MLMPPGNMTDDLQQMARPGAGNSCTFSRAALVPNPGTLSRVAARDFDEGGVRSVSQFSVAVEWRKRRLSVVLLGRP